ncbi:hypothetical protein AA958_22880 [Streptomyces sp. CNQ-509]|uniref:beta family protein n=1 Tax=Streptomyces sp. CNQ-509 TaxID=444103 RepID=UPI00062DCF66|nr:hypothetical protein [Streptomyces sp. CNQ-509]AKH84574.1 hypothetical protein AA958_22880 [Streptomyces sp. CNQ-509]
MPGPLYIPVLPVRAHAASAFGKLDAETADRTVPLWTLPEIGGGARQPADTVKKALRRIVRVQQRRAAWLDTPFTALDHDPYEELLRYCWSATPLLPVADPARPRSHQALAAECAAAAGGGLGVRIRVPGAFRDELTAHTQDLLVRVGVGVPVDLLLDLQAVLPTRPDAAKEAIRALDELVPLAAWRTVALLSGGFPDEAGRVLDRGRGVAARTDWHTWCELRTSERSYARSVRYGDYGTLAARNLTRPVEGSERSRYGLLRYTTERAFLLASFLVEGRGETGATRAAARWVTESSGYRGTRTSEGDRWYAECALTTGAAGTGNPTTWNTMGNIQHMTFVVQSLSRGGR